MKNRNKKRRDYLGILLLLVVGLSVGYALLQTTLTINGTSKIKGNTWDIHFENLQVTGGSVAIGTGDSAATIQSSTTDITYTVTLNEPGDFYEFTVDAVNYGTIDGMVESVTSKLNNQPITTLPAYLDYSVTYKSDDDIEVNHYLKSGGTETYKVRIEFKRDIDESNLPTTVQTLTMSFGVVYVQADSNAVDVVHRQTVYATNFYPSNDITMNYEFPATVPYFKTPSQALNYFRNESSFDVNSYLRYELENNIAKKSYVEFIITDEMAQNNPSLVPGTYVLEGGFDEYDKPAEERTVFNANVEVIKTAFGYDTNPSICTSHDMFFECCVNKISATANTGGDVFAGIFDDRCLLNTVPDYSCYAGGNHSCCYYY